MNRRDRVFVWFLMLVLCSGCMKVRWDKGVWVGEASEALLIGHSTAQSRAVSFKITEPVRPGKSRTRGTFILVDEQGYCLDAEKYAGRRLRLKGKIGAGRSGKDRKTGATFFRRAYETPPPGDFWVLVVKEKDIVDLGSR